MTRPGHAAAPAVYPDRVLVKRETAYGAQPTQRRRSAAEPAPAHARPAAVRRADSGEAAALGRGERIILTAIAQNPDGATLEQLTVLTGYKRESRRTYLQRLSSAELVVKEGDRICATAAGIDALGNDHKPLPVGDALRSHWLNKLGGGGEKVILEAVCDVYPSAISKEELGRITSYKRESLRTYLQRLSARRLITVDRGDVRAADELFSRRARR